ncbi:hypothetical protein RUM44_005337 [Polyplax serrata]|uniref:Uncharacterized protein n=1 Tax=Polyplax serrata TaxID=468196 RepID=A0ABR1AD94_POLSC
MFVVCRKAEDKTDKKARLVEKEKGTKRNGTSVAPVYWISWFLLLSTTCVSLGISEEPGRKSQETNASVSQPTTTTTTTTTTTASLEVGNKNEAGYKETSQVDLDLETQDQVAILKQINRVNDDGSYTFGYEAADGSFKIETRDVNGNVKGMFGFINEDGELKRVSYSASNGTGFQSTGTLNIPPLPGTTLSDDERSQGYSRFGHDRFLPDESKMDVATKINLLDSTTPAYKNTDTSTPARRLPVYIFGSSTPITEVTSSSKPVVIQHIPKVRPTPASSATLPTESEEILLKPLLSDLAPKRTSNTNFISFGTSDVTPSSLEVQTTTEEPGRNPSVIQVIRPRIGPVKKVIVTKRPVVTTTPKIVTTTEYKSKQYLEKLKNKSLETGNGVRRQLAISRDNHITTTTANLVTSGTEDSPDVYGGRHISRPYPTNAYRALFSQVPQHQRILQNSYVQNRNQYLAAALGNPSVLPTTSAPHLQSTTTPGPIRNYPGVASVPQDSNISPVQGSYVHAPPQQPLPDPRPINLPPPAYLRQYPQTVVPNNPTPVPNTYQSEQSSSQILIPPSLLEHLIRMLLVAQHRLASHQRSQQMSPFQQAVVATLGPGNVPPELLSNRYDHRFYQPQGPYPYVESTASRTPYEAQYPYYSSYVPFDPRYPYHHQMFTLVPYTRYQPRTHTYDLDPSRQQQTQDDYLFRMLLGYPRFQSQAPVPGIQPTSNVVERSPAYEPGRDSTTSSTTPASRIGQVRNVQILGQINDDSQTSTSNESSTKSVV